jgi:tetratricopeptide (TPR) repeat protein
MAALLTAVPSVAAQDVPDSLFVPALGARSLGMGAAVALSGEVSCGAHNPALLAFTTPWRTTVDYRHLSSRVQALSLYTVNDYSRRGLTYGVGVDFVRANRRVWPRTPSVVRNWRVQATLGLAHQLSNGVALGGALKPARWKLYREDDSSIEMDLGVAYPTRWRDIDFVVGAVARDILGAEVSRRGGDTALDVSVLLGVTGHYFSGDSLWEATLAADLEAVEQDYVGSPQGRFRVGGELAYLQSDDLRLSGRVGHDGEHVTLGLGVDYRFISIDWAKTAWAKWGHGQALSVSINPLEFWDWFGTTTGTAGPAVQWRDSLPVYRQEEYSDYDQAAGRQLDRQQFDSALVLYHKAHIFADSPEEQARAEGGIARAQDGLDRQRAAAVSARLDSVMTQAQGAVADSIYGQMLAEADSCLEQRDYACALDRLNTIPPDHPAGEQADELRARVLRARDRDIAIDLVEGDSLERENRLREALDKYNGILRLQPNNEGAAKGKERVQNRDDARLLVARALDLYEKNARVAAQGAIDSALKLDPSFQNVRDFLVTTFPNFANTISLEEIQRDSTVYDYYIQGLRFRSNHEYQQAVDAFSMVLKSYPNCPEVREVYKEALSMYNLSRRDSTP